MFNVRQFADSIIVASLAGLNTRRWSSVKNFINYLINYLIYYYLKILSLSDRNSFKNSFNFIEIQLTMLILVGTYFLHGTS